MGSHLNLKNQSNKGISHTFLSLKNITVHLAADCMAFVILQPDSVKKGKTGVVEISIPCSCHGPTWQPSRVKLLWTAVRHATCICSLSSSSLMLYCIMYCILFPDYWDTPHLLQRSGRKHGLIFKKLTNPYMKQVRATYQGDKSKLTTALFEHTTHRWRSYKGQSFIALVI